MDLPADVAAAFAANFGSGLIKEGTIVQIGGITYLACNGMYTDVINTIVESAIDKFALEFTRPPVDKIVDNALLAIENTVEQATGLSLNSCQGGG